MVYQSIDPYGRYGYVGTDALRKMDKDELLRYVGCLESIIFEQSRVLTELSKTNNLLKSSMNNLMKVNEYDHIRYDHENNLVNMTKKTNDFSYTILDKYFKDEDEDECTTQ